MKQAFRIKARTRGRPSASAKSLNEDSASDVSNDINTNRQGNLPPRAAAKKMKLNSCSPLAQILVSKSNAAGSVDEYSSALKCCLLSAGSSVVPLSGRRKSGDKASDILASVKLARLKRGRRAFEGGPISEERFREMQAEVYRLKKELADKAEQHKILVRRLTRVDDAAKRKLRSSVENLSLLPKQKFSMMALLTQNYNAEKSIQELEESLKACQRDNGKYLQYVRRYKAESEWLKRKLEVTVRTNRRTGSFCSEDILKHYKEMVKDLQKQLLSLQEETSCPSSHGVRKGADRNLSAEHLADQSDLDNHSGLSIGENAGQPQTEVNFESPILRTSLRGGNNEHCHDSENIEQMARFSGQLPPDELHFAEPEATECPFKDTMVDQSIGDTLSTFDVTSQLMETWERLKTLSVNYTNATHELSQLKYNHEHCLKNLQDAYRDLSQERRNCLKLQGLDKRLTLELAASKQVQVVLQQVRQQNVQLEIENAELVASALNVPRTNFSELKTLRQQLVDELKQRNLAEAKALKATNELEDCKQDLARLAVVEANWEYLKSELKDAKKAVTRANQKVKELQESHEMLQKEMMLKGTESLQTKLLKNLSHLPGKDSEEDEEISPRKGSMKELSSESGSDALVSDSISAMQQANGVVKHQTPEIGLCTFDQRNRRECKGSSPDVEVWPSFPEALSNRIIFTIINLELNAFTDLSSIRTIWVRFQFLVDFCEDDDQRTNHVSNDTSVLQFSYSRAFSVDKMAHADAREFLRKMLDSEATAFVKFQVFGERMDNRPTKLLGSCQFNLWAAMYQEDPKDTLETHLEVRSSGSRPTSIGKLHIAIQGLELLRDIHGLDMPNTGP